MKIYIDSNLTPRYSPNGWPDKNQFTEYVPGSSHFFEGAYNDALEKAKADSVPFDITHPLTDAALALAYHKSGLACQMKDIFIEVEIGEVEIIYQVKNYGGWSDISFEDLDSTDEDYRTVARLKKAENAAMLDSAGEQIPAGYTQCPTCHGSGELIPDVDCRKCEGSGYVPQNAEPDPRDLLKEHLDVAKARIKELEQWQQEELIVWGPVLDYCQDEANAKRLGIGLGQSISTRVLEILKGIK